MIETDIRKYAELMREFGLTRLEINEGDAFVKLERAAAENARANAENTGENNAPRSPETTTERSGARKAEGGYSVTSPMVGVLYLSPAENAEPFVRVGDAVKKGDTLCIIEAMKLMNEITAERDGTIVEICVKNAQVVDYGFELFKMK